MANLRDAPLGTLLDIHPKLGDRDHFRLAPHALNLARAIFAEDAQSGRVIAINGEWGSGKTSLYRLARAILSREEWDEVRQRDLSEEDFVTILAPFSSGPDDRRECVADLKRLYQEDITFAETEIWTGGSVIDLIFTLIDTIDDAVNSENGRLGKVWKGVSRAVTRNPTPILQLAGVAFGALSFGLAGSQFQVGTDGVQVSGMGPARARRELKSRLEAEIGERKLVLVIDDVDRLTPERLAQLMSAIWWVRDLRNVIVLVLFDRARVARAISHQLFGDIEHAEDEAGRYLEKIVQFSYDVPLPSARQMFDRSRRMIEAEAGTIWEDRTPFLETTRESEARQLITRLVVTPRAAKQLEQAVLFALRTLPKTRINLVDLTVLAATRLFRPETLTEVQTRCRTVEVSRSYDPPPPKPIDPDDENGRLVAFFLPADHRAADQNQPIEDIDLVEARDGFGHPNRFQMYLVSYQTDEELLDYIARAFVEAALNPDSAPLDATHDLDIERSTMIQGRVNRIAREEYEDEERETILRAATTLS